MLRMNLLDDKSEKVEYNLGKLPVKCVMSSQADYPMLSVVNHWHTDFEFVYVTKGSIMYNVNGTICRVNKGEMIFINSAQMHFGFWETKSECDFLCVVIHPAVFEAEFVQQYLSALMSSDMPSFYIFRPIYLHEMQITNTVAEILQYTDGKYGCEIAAMSILYKLLLLLCEHFRNISESRTLADNKRYDAMHRMVGFIQQNYSDKLNLEDIAAAGMVCRSVCCEIFKLYLKKTPVEYLNEYRISKSIELLEKTSDSTTEIAGLCGFASASYFTATFRNQIGFTPMQYRKRRRK